MSLANKKAEQLRRLAAESGDRAKIDAVQSFSIVVGERLGLDDEALWSWRCGIVWHMCGRPAELAGAARLIQHPELFRLVAECAGVWMEGGPPDIGVAVEPQVLEAWEYALTVVMPMEPGQG